MKDIEKITREDEIIKLVRKLERSKDNTKKDLVCNFRSQDILG